MARRKCFSPAVYLDLTSKPGEARAFTINDVLAENALLKKVAKAGEDLAVAVREWAQELNNTTINDCDVLAIRFQEAHARLQKEEKCDGRTV